MQKSNKKNSYPLLVLAIAIVVVSVDQLTKHWALENLPAGKAVPVLGKALQWILVKNPGAAFSFLENATWVFTIISSLVAIFVLVIAWRVKKVSTAIVAGLVLSGAVGNLIDRLFREPGFALGHVIDFIYTPWIVPAVYNVADIAIVTGMGLFLLLTIFPTSKKNNQELSDNA